MTIHVEQSDVEIAAAMASEVAVPRERVEVFRSLNVPRLDDYFGAWSIEPIRGLAMLEHVGRMVVTAHVREHKAERRSYVSRWQQAGDDDVELLSDDEIEAEMAAKSDDEPTAPTIAVIEITGTLMKSSSSLGSSSSTVELRAAIRAAANDPSVGGILLKVDSPGGTVSGTSDCADAILYAVSKKPTWAFGEDLVASAALWLSTQAEKFFANSKTAMIGSIGTVIGLYDYSGAMGQAGIKAKVYATGPLKGAGFPGKEITSSQDEYFQSVVDDTQQHFRAAVASGRKMHVNQVRSLETGGMFSASEAMANGLIDGIQSFEKTMSQMFREIKARSQSVTPKGTNMATKLVETKAEETPAATVDKSADRASVIGELNTFVNLFGADNGAKWFGEGISMTDALLRQCNVLTENLTSQLADRAKLIAEKDATIADLESRLKQIQVGDKSGVSFADAENPSKESKNLKTTSTGIARMANGMKLPTAKV